MWLVLVPRHYLLQSIIPPMFRRLGSTVNSYTHMKTLRHSCLTLVGLVALLAVTGCSTTEFTTTWNAPDAQLTHIEPGAKVGALVMHPELPVERAAEDALAAELTKRGAVGVAAYTILGDTEPRDEDAARKEFAKSGAAAVVVMRGIGEQTEVDYRAPTYYNAPTYSGFWGGYYGHSWTAVSDPGYLRTSRVVTVATQGYDLESNKLVWGGRSRTVDPSKLKSFMKEIVDEVAKEMRKSGVL